MSMVPAELKYSKTHEWVLIDGDVATIGITDHAQAELGDIVYLDLTEVGRVLKSEDQFGEVESVKAVSELYSPLSGEVVGANTKIADAPDVINTDPYGNGWLVKLHLSVPAELTQLMNAADYEKFSSESAH